MNNYATAMRVAAQELLSRLRDHSCMETSGRRKRTVNLRYFFFH
jgi:hypothetical protein